MGEIEKWERKNINISLFKDLLIKWVKDRKKVITDHLFEEQVSEFAKQYEDALSVAFNGNTQHLKDLYFKALRVRQNFSVDEARRDPGKGVFVWLSDDQMDEWKEALQKQEILTIN